jgi:hypothetical protein
VANSTNFRIGAKVKMGSIFFVEMSDLHCVHRIDGVPRRGRMPAIERQCRPDPADIPAGERALRRELLHLLRDFSQ